jgi:putative transcriptional regulator
LPRVPEAKDSLVNYNLEFISSGGHRSCQLPVQMKNQLGELRALKQWSQGDLAERLSVSRQTINAIETEKYDPSLRLAFKIAQLFKHPIEEIFDPGD